MGDDDGSGMGGAGGGMGDPSGSGMGEAGGSAAGGDKTSGILGFFSNFFTYGKEQDIIAKQGDLQKFFQPGKYNGSGNQELIILFAVILVLVIVLFFFRKK